VYRCPAAVSRRRALNTDLLGDLQSPPTHSPSTLEDGVGESGPGGSFAQQLRPGSPWLARGRA
jgi:hypothetical protein